MPHRPRYRRASASTLLLALLAAACVVVLSLRVAPRWNGVAMDATVSEVVSLRGEPHELVEMGGIDIHKYADMDVWLRDGRVFSLVIRGESRELYGQACLLLGLPIASDDDRTLWHWGTTTASLHEGTLTIYGE